MGDKFHSADEVYKAITGGGSESDDDALLRAKVIAEAFNGGGSNKDIVRRMLEWSYPSSPPNSLLPALEEWQSFEYLSPRTRSHVGAMIKIVSTADYNGNEAASLAMNMLGAVLKEMILTDMAHNFRSPRAKGKTAIVEQHFAANPDELQEDPHAVVANIHSVHKRDNPDFDETDMPGYELVRKLQREMLK